MLPARRGRALNHKPVYRLYREEHLAVRRLKRKRLLRPAQPMSQLDDVNQEWAMDFVMDSLASGRGFRALTLLDGFTRECLAIEVDSCLASRRVTRVLEWVISQRGRPRSIRCDNGPEFTSRHFLGWCEEQQIRLLHIQPGRPMQNGRVESFNGRLRDECLNASWVLTLAEAKHKIEAWREEYNRERPHSSLDYQTPEEFARGLRPFAVESFDSAGCSAHQGNPGGRASLGLDPPPLRRPGVLIRRRRGRLKCYVEPEFLQLRLVGTTGAGQRLSTCRNGFTNIVDS